MCLSPLASGTCWVSMRPLGKQGDSLELGLPKGCLFHGQFPHTRTTPHPPPAKTPRLVSQPYLLKTSFVSAFLGDGILLSLSPFLLGPRVFPKGTNLTWRIGFLVKEQTHPLPNNYIFKKLRFCQDGQARNELNLNSMASRISKYHIHF